MFKNDSAGILSTHEVLMADATWEEISNIQIGNDIQSYSISGSPQSESDLNSLTWNYDGSEFPEGSFLTTSSVVFKDVANLKYNSMMEMVVDSDSLFSGINKKYLVYDSLTNKSSYKFITEINSITDYLYDTNGQLIQVDELNFYVSSENGLSFIELDVEDSDTYIINGSTAFHSVVSHNSPCFVAGTPILMADGSHLNIEDVKIGDKIFVYCHESYNRIKEVIVTEIIGSVVYPNLTSNEIVMDSITVTFNLIRENQKDKQTFFIRFSEEKSRRGTSYTGFLTLEDALEFAEFLKDQKIEELQKDIERVKESYNKLLISFEK